MRQYTKMSPLTEDERDFAEKNHAAVLWFIKSYELDFDDYYDVAVMGYLKAVKKWFERPDIHRYSFLKIAKNCMRSYVGCEQRKRAREIPTMSLDEVVPGTDGLTYADTITCDNLIFTDWRNGKEMQIRYNVQLPEKPNHRVCAKSDERIAIEAFLIGKMRNMCFEYETVIEAKKKLSSIRSTRRNKGEEDIYDAWRKDNCIYIERLPLKKERG